MCGLLSTGYDYLAMAVCVRSAELEDAEGIARVQIDAWRQAYAHIFAPQVLEDLDLANSTARKRRLIGEGVKFLVAVDGGEVLGYAGYGASRQPEVPTDGELHAIYVHPEAHRRGLGTALVEETVVRLIADGFNSMSVFYFAANTDARAFYEAIGASFTGSESLR